jgi:hypothetical protein
MSLSSSADADTEPEIVAAAAAATIDETRRRSGEFTVAPPICVPIQRRFAENRFREERR